VKTEKFQKTCNVARSAKLGDQVGMGRIGALAIAALLATILNIAPARAQNAYVSNSGDDTVSVIATATNTVTGTISVGVNPIVVAVSPDGNTVYVANFGSNTVSVISAATNTVIGTINVRVEPFGLAMSPDGGKVYVANFGANTVSVIATTTNTVTATIGVGASPIGVIVTPDGSTVYVANYTNAGTVSVITTATDTVTATINVGSLPDSVAVTPDGSTVYVVNYAMAGTVSVISTASKTVTGTINVGNFPNGLAVTPDGSTVYVANDNSSGTVSVIATGTSAVTATISVGNLPNSVAITPDGSVAYVTNEASNNVSVIATATNTVSNSIGVGATPIRIAIGPVLQTLTVAETGSGSGQVTSSPVGINCSATSNQCAASFGNTSMVTLTASAGSGSSFTGWSGGGCSGTGACSVTMSQAQSVTATFIQIPSFMLSVAPGGSGSGTVTSNPSGINCGATCSASFQSGASVTLTAVPASGSVFAGWSGGGCVGTGACIVNLSANTSVTATFMTAPNVSLSITSAGSGSGTVTSNPLGINCGATCSAGFQPGTTVTLTATAAAGSSFAGWSGGGCSGPASCMITLNGDTAVVATFSTIPSFTLSITSLGSGSGTVTSSPSGINCGTICSASFQSGTLVALSPIAASGSVFAGWSGGGCGGTGACMITLSQATSVTASFATATQSTFPVTVSSPSNGTITSSPPGINCPGTCSFNFPVGTVVSLAYTPVSGFQFVGWNGACSGVGTCRVVVAQSEGVTGNFTPSNPSATNSSQLVAAVLPSSRSIQVGASATAFATIINSGSSIAPQCTIVPIGSLPLGFTYQTTDPATNAVIGNANTPIDIAAGASQSFVIALTPTSAIAPQAVNFAFAGANVAEAPDETGLNTLLFSASTTPVPDIVALVATAQNDGILHITGTTGANAFAVATVNLGASGAITAAASTSGGGVLLSPPTMCQTNPASGQCISPVGVTVPTTINAGDTPTFAVFGQANGAIPFDPANSRIFVQFTDGAGAVRGLTSVAVETQ
jgi:YVTN family beta-propeller protein